MRKRDIESKQKYHRAMQHYLGSKDSVSKIASRYKISARRFAVFLHKNGIQTVKCRNKKYNVSKDAWDLADLGNLPDSQVAKKLEVPRRLVTQERLIRGIKSFSQQKKWLYMLREGVPCRSKYEAMYDVYLHENNIQHEHEVKVGPYIADIRIGNGYHEIAGMIGYPRYNKKYKEKKQFYSKNNINVKWLFVDDIEKLYKTCKTEMIFREKICEDCKTNTFDMVKNVCRICYMKRWHDKGQHQTCERCKKCFVSPDNDGRKFCSHQCYSKSLSRNGTDYASVLAELEQTGEAVHAYAKRNNIPPGRLYTMLRRQDNKEKGLTGEGQLRKRI